MTTGKSAVSGPNSMTAIMGADGKASSLRKLVVDGVDDSAIVQVCHSVAAINPKGGELADAEQ